MIPLHAFVLILILHTQVYKATKTQIVWLQLNEKKGKPDMINELILKTKAYLKEGPDSK